jgi:Zn-dependent protease
MGVTREDLDLHSSLPEIVINYMCLLFSLCVHEASHAAMADRCGDPTGRLLGRISLNPIRHADPIGTVLLPLFAMITRFPFFIGWAKPVPFNPRNLRNRRRDPVLIALAGPVSNFLVALSAAVILRIIAQSAGAIVDSPVLPLLLTIFVTLVGINIMLMVFNFLPIPPLDGYHLLDYFLPPAAREFVDRFGPYSMLFLMLIVFNTRILQVPMELLNRGIMYLAFAGTPLSSILSGP